MVDQILFITFQKETIVLPFLFVLHLFSHFCLVFLYRVSLVGRLLGYTWEYDVAGPWWGIADGSFFVGNEICR